MASPGGQRAKRDERFVEDPEPLAASWPARGMRGARTQDLADLAGDLDGASPRMPSSTSRPEAVPRAVRMPLDAFGCAR